MSNRCKVRVKWICVSAVIAIVFIITMQANAKDIPLFPTETNCENYVDTPPSAQKSRVIDTISPKQISKNSKSTDAIKDTIRNDSMVSTVDTLSFKLFTITVHPKVNFSLIKSIIRLNCGKIEV